MDALEKPIDYKVYLCVAGFQPEVRRFTVDKSISRNYFYLKKKLMVIFPVLKDAVFSISWKDKEGDSVRICSDEELGIFINEIGTDSCLKIYVAMDKGEDGPLHPNVTCDGCEQQIQGFRYKCIVCTNFDLCPDCERSQTHPDHPMLRIPLPLSLEDQLCRKFFSKISRNMEHLRQASDRWDRKEKRGKQRSEKCRRGGGDGGGPAAGESASYDPFLDFLADRFDDFGVNIPEHLRSYQRESDRSRRPSSEQEGQQSSSNEYTNFYSQPADCKKFCDIIKQGITSFLDPLGAASFGSDYQEAAGGRGEPAGGESSRPTTAGPQTQPQPSQPQPESTQSQPQPQPSPAETQPLLPQAQSELTRSQLSQSQPELTQSQLSQSQSQTEFSQAQLYQSQPELTQSQAQPEPTQPQPFQAQPEPLQSQMQPEGTQPVPTLLQPEPAQSQPQSYLLQPEPAQSQPQPSLLQPEPAQSQPQPSQPRPLPLSYLFQSSPIPLPYMEKDNNTQMYPALVKKEDSPPPVLDSTWTVINSNGQCSVDNTNTPTGARPRYRVISHGSMGASAPPEVLVPPRVLPAQLPHPPPTPTFFSTQYGTQPGPFPYWSSATSRSGPQKTTPGTPVEEAMQKLLEMGFSDDGNWLRLLVENKNGNLEEILQFLTPIKKSSPNN